ncbi:30S ribosomal S20 domain protein [Helicobacter pylori R030b]|nr:30S ribosomal S20 domain protein [Helicobacter pylori R030b]
MSFCYIIDSNGFTHGFNDIFNFSFIEPVAFGSFNGLSDSLFCGLMICHSLVLIPL